MAKGYKNKQIKTENTQVISNTKTVSMKVSVNASWVLYKKWETYEVSSEVYDVLIPFIN
jgi:hypothetical protein